MVYDLRCIYIGNEPSFALETKVRNVSNNINRSLIGNILKSIRVEKNIPMKKIASALKISESTVSQIETGKNSATKEKINEICHVCGCSFDYKTDRKKMIDLVLYIYAQYSNLSTDEMNSTIEEVKNNSFISCSYARFEYYLILYMDGIINQNNEDVQLFKRILEIGKSSFSNKELSIYYDIKALEKMYLNDSIKALEYLNQSRLYDNEFLMNHYHYCSIYLNLGYYTLAQKYIRKSIEIAIKEVSFERLCYLLLNQGVLYLNTEQYVEAENLNLKLLKESKIRNEEFLKYCILSNLVLISLLQKNYENGFKYLGMVDQKYLEDDYDLVLYRILLHLFIKDYTLAKKYIRQSLSNNSIGKYYKNFFQGLKYLIDNKREKAVDRIESCYNLALTAGEVDRAMLVLKLLNELYLDCRLQNKLRKVKELQENFYKMSYANQIIEDIELKLN